MAVQIEPPGQLQEFLGILKKRKWQVLLPTLFFLSLGVGFAVIVPKKFLVETQIELRALHISNGGNIASVKERTAGVAQNAPQQIKSMHRITEVIESLKWTDYLPLDRQEKAEYRTRIRDNIKVEVPKKGKDVGSSFVTIEYRDVNRDRAQAFLKALRKAWIEQVVERDRTRIDVEYTNLLNRKGELEKEWYKESELRSQLRIAHEISPTQPTPGKNERRSEDPVISRYVRSSDRLDEVEMDLKVASASLKLRREQLADTEPEIPRDIEVVHGVDFAKEIEELLDTRAALEAQLDGIKPAHSRFRSVQAKLRDLDERIRDLEGQQTESEINQDFAPNPYYTTLVREVAQLEAKVVELETERETLREVLALNRGDRNRLAEAYREDSEHSTRIDILTVTLEELEIQLQESKQLRDVIYGPTGNPFQIIQEVEPPADPSEPDPVLIIVFSIVLGLAVGLGSAIVGEFSKNCFRNTSDLSRVLVVPILGVISPIVTRAQRRRRGFQRFVVGVASLAMIGIVVFVTWAWAYEPNLLGDSVLDSIEGLRSMFL